jgi:choice-of-anchor B domain-containing protein
MNVRSIRWSLLVVLLTAGVSRLFGQATGDVTLFGSLDPRTGNNSSCWGYVTPDGREYALLGAQSGTSIIDINGLPLREVGFISGPSSTWRELKTWSHYAYVVSEGGGGVQIIDLSKPDSARLVRSFNHTDGTKNTLRSHAITIADGYMYLSGCANWSPGGVLIFSLAIPDSPSFVGQFQPEYIHDCYVRNDTLYGAAIYSGGGMHVVNVSNKSVPQAITKITYTGSGTHNAWATVNGKYAYTTDEIGTTTRNMKIWDIGDLPSWRPAGTFTPRPGNTIHNVHGRGNYAYISHYGSWMIVADIHNDTIPIERGSYRTSSSGLNWGVYPYFPSGKWISSDQQNGLFVATFADLLPRTRAPLMSPADEEILDTVSVEFQWHSAANRAEDPHWYKLHVFGPGLDTLIRSSDTTILFTNTASLQLDEPYRWHVWIEDEYTRVSSADTFQFVISLNAPLLATDVDSLDFGMNLVDSTSTLSITVSNTGLGPLTIDSVRSSNGVFMPEVTGSVVIPPDSDHTFHVSFTPDDSITYHETLTVFSNSVFHPQKEIMLTGRGAVLVGIQENRADVGSFSLDQNYPNPFNPSTVIRFSLPTAGYVTLKVFSVLGEEVATLVNGPTEPGNHEISWNAAGLPSGVYVYRLSAGHYSSSKKLLFLK